MKIRFGFNPILSLLPKMSFTVTLLIPWPPYKYPKVGLPGLNSQVYYYKQSDNEGIDIVEEYCVKSGPLITNRIGSWNQSQGLRIAEPNINERRADLKGVRLVNGLMPWRVFNTLRTGNGTILESIGPIPDIFNYLSTKLNFTYELVQPKDKKWGSLDLDGKTWNGLVKELMENRIDITTSGLTQTLDRHKAVDFSLPLAVNYATLIGPVNRGQATQFWVYLDIFPIEIWICVAVMTAMNALGFLAMENTRTNNFHRPQDSENFNMFNSLSVCILELLQIGYNVIIASASSKVLFLVMSLFGYLIFTYYTCDLTARMTSGPPKSTVRSFQDVLDNDYHVIVMGATSNEELLANSDEGSAMHSVYYNRMRGTESAFVNTTAVGLKRILTEEKTLYYSLSFTVLGLSDFEALDIAERVKSYNGWAFKKGSELTSFFNYHLLRMDENGLLRKIFHVSLGGRSVNLLRTTYFWFSEMELHGGGGVRGRRSPLFGL